MTDFFPGSGRPRPQGVNRTVPLFRAKLLPAGNAGQFSSCGGATLQSRPARSAALFFVWDSTQTHGTLIKSMPLVFATQCVRFADRRLWRAAPHETNIRGIIR